MQESAPDLWQRKEMVSIPERELLGFVRTVTELLGTEQSGFLREIWLDELASMDTMPGPASPEWRLVTLAAWGRLAGRLVDLRLISRCFSTPTRAMENDTLAGTDADA